MKKKSLLCSIALLLSITSCSRIDFPTSLSQTSSLDNSSIISSVESTKDESSLSSSQNNLNSSSSITLTPPEVFEDPSYDSSSDTVINLLNDEITVENNNGYVKLENDVIWILKEGTYSFSGTFIGQILINAPEAKVNIDLNNASITNSSKCPFLIYNADKCEISAKSGTTNYIKDFRSEENDDFSSSIYAECDLEIKGKGFLFIESNSNNGIHTKDDLLIKNLSLHVKAINNAIKGNDSLTIESGNITAISTKGDCLKTTNTDISSKGNQRGTITISGGVLNLYAACDAIDAAYDVIINNNPTINCYTDSYSEYSEEVSVVSNNIIYLKANQSLSNYSFKLLVTLENGSEEIYSFSKISDSFSREICFKTSIPSEIKTYRLYAFSSTNSSTSLDDCDLKSDILNANTKYDCLSVSKRTTSLFITWTTYSTKRPGGMQEGNPNKADYSCKGIKSSNSIIITGGTINIKSHDDALHAKGGETLENGSIGLGNISISDGYLCIYSDDDGIHADYTLSISGGNIEITNFYEGLEGNIINIAGGSTKLIAKDDGINATSYKDTPCINISNGILYIDAAGDGIDSNGNIVMSGGYVLAQGPSNSGNGVLDYDRTFTSTGGYLLAIGASGMNQSVSASGNAKSFTKSISTNTSSYVTLMVDGVNQLIIKVSRSNMNYCVGSYVGSSYLISVTTSVSETLVDNIYYVNI